jgi:hypothetical protein
LRLEMAVHSSEPVSRTLIFKKTAGGTVGIHPVRPTHAALVAATHQQEFNTIRSFPTPFACWKIEDLRFEFDSSIIRPEIAEEMRTLAQLIDENTEGDERPLSSLFGHADPVGDEEYNKTLSGRRARAVYGLLTRRADIWEDLYTRPFGGDSWQNRSTVATMLAVAGYGNSTQEVKRFQQDHGLTDDGVVGPNTRGALFKAYMDALCPITLDPQKDFLGRGQDPAGKADYQSCGEFNALMRFSQEEERMYSRPENRAERNAENARSRRVVIYLFRPLVRTNLQRWPCPRVSEGMAGCKRRFWSDAQERQSPQGIRREYEETHDTFACRFYDRLASQSPCEDLSNCTPFHISLLLRSNSGGVVLRQQPYLLHLSQDTLVRGTTDDEGHILVENVPAGDYLLEIGDCAAYVPSLPRELEPRLTRMPGFHTG